MEKLMMSIMVTPKTREKLAAMKEASGLSFGQLFDKLVMEYPICELNQDCEKTEVNENAERVA